MAALGSPAITKEAARAWAYGQDRARARTQAPAASFVVAGDPEATPGSPACKSESGVANFVNFYVADSARAARLQTSARLLGYTENPELPNNLSLPGCLVYARLHLPG